MSTVSPPARNHLPPQAQGTSIHTHRWLLSTPSGTWHAEGGEPLTGGPGQGQFAHLAATTLNRLRACPPDTAVVGVVPFEESTAARLILALMRRQAGRPEKSAPVPPPAPPTAFGRPRPEPSEHDYLAAATHAVRTLRAGAADKVVLARTLSLAVHGTPDWDTVSSLLDGLAHRDPRAHLFAATLPHRDGTDGAPTGPPILFGATPETLLTRFGDRLTLNPLAGTAPRHPDPATDHTRARALRRSAKDLTEHRFVVDALRDQLAPLCRTIEIPREPALLATRRLWHLSTTIRARLHHPAPDALALALLLHPTPAVCGSPARTARALIRELEPVPRGYYSGLIGWMNQAGDGQWDIALRCGELDDTRLRLYAGAGITAQSDPCTELAETTAKFTTMLDVLPLR
ncbi:isochorismate synthase [Streptomyces microflavus]|uniref:isochorismate synthase n=1 Tax=Streptomyces microflavus TaxID=1919 RepID=UPI00340F7F19